MPRTSWPDYDAYCGFDAHSPPRSFHSFIVSRFVHAFWSGKETAAELQNYSRRHLSKTSWQRVPREGTLDSIAWEVSSACVRRRRRLKTRPLAVDCVLCRLPMGPRERSSCQRTSLYLPHQKCMRMYWPAIITTDDLLMGCPEDIIAHQLPRCSTFGMLSMTIC